MSKSQGLEKRFGATLAQTINLRPQSAPPPAEVAPDKYHGAVKSRVFAEMLVDEIIGDIQQPREEFDQPDLQRLADSIVRFGQLSPIRIRRDEKLGRWVVLVGERRLRASKLAGLERIRVEFVEREMTEADILAEQTVENMVRAPLSPVEQGKAYKRLMDLQNWTAQALSDEIGVEVTTIYRGLKLIGLPPEVATLVDTGKIKATAAYEVAKVEDPDLQRTIAAKVIEQNLDHKATVDLVNKNRKSSGPAKGKNGKGRGASGKLPKEWRYRRAGGASVVVTAGRKGTDLASAIELLEQALTQARGEMQPGSAAA